MRRSRIAFLIAGGLSLGLSAPALAADMALKAPPPPLLFDWTGFYGGVNTGYSWGHSRATTDSTALGVTDTESVAHHGWEASVEGGYCWQNSTSTAMVACIEARYDFPREHSGQTTTTTLPLTTLTNSTNVDPFLIGPHLGFLTDSNHMMWYAAGGLAIGEVGGSSTGVGVGGTSTATPSNKTTEGWFLGAGIEHMIDQHWSWKAEYDYVRLGSNGATGFYTGTEYALLTGSGSTASLGGHAYDNVVSFGINYHLGTH
jgi:outer membrane immunogenic protein